jgi:hypothetical protein
MVPLPIIQSSITAKEEVDVQIIQNASEQNSRRFL